jgi:hypothetical protein
MISMIRVLVMAVFALMLPGYAAAQGKGPNGGTVVTVEDHPVEFVTRGQEIAFYIGNHDGKPLATKGLQARALVQDGGKTTTVALVSQEPNALVGKLAAPLGKGARIVLSTRVDGHALQARFVVD